MNRVDSARVDKRLKSSSNDKQPFLGGSSRGWIIEPHYAIVISLLYVGVVIILHMIGKYRKDASSVAQ